MTTEGAPTQTDGDGLRWAVYEDECALCHKPIRIVATVHSVAEGYSEWHNGPRLCSECEGERK